MINSTGLRPLGVIHLARHVLARIRRHTIQLLSETFSTRLSVLPPRGDRAP